MTTPTAAAASAPAPSEASAPDRAAELEASLRRDEISRQWVGLRRARALANSDAPPPGPRDLTGLAAVMQRAYDQQAILFHVSEWAALNAVYQRASAGLNELSSQAERTPQVAVQAARVTALAASLMARHADQAVAYFEAKGQRDNPGAQAMRAVARASETLALRAAGLDIGQELDLPGLRRHTSWLNRELRQAEAARPGVPTDPELVDSDDPALESFLTLGAGFDAELAEASLLMKDLNGLAARARRVGERAVLDVRLHGLVETAQLRGVELISNIARRAVERYDGKGRQSIGRRDIAVMIRHYAEQRLERIRGTLGAEERREPGYYESGEPTRYQDALANESRAVAEALKARDLPREDRVDLQIRFLLAQRALAELEGDDTWGAQPDYPPKEFVAGWDAGPARPFGLYARRALVEALVAEVQSRPSHRTAPFLAQVARRYAREIAGPAELSPEAVEATITAKQIADIAEQLVVHKVDASPLALACSLDVDVTHAQAERALDILHTLGVVGPTQDMQPRATQTASADALHDQLAGLEERLPQLLAEQRPAAPQPAKDSAPAGPGQQEASLPPLPKREREAERRHPGNVPKKELPANPSAAAVLALLKNSPDRIEEAARSLQEGAAARAAAPQPPTDPPAAESRGAQHDAQQQAQQPEQSAGAAPRR